MKLGHEEAEVNLKYLGTVEFYKCDGHSGNPTFGK